MCPHPAVGISFIEEAHIRMSTQNHVACSIHDAVVWISCNVVKEKIDCLSGGDSGFGLACCNCTEGDK